MDSNEQSDPVEESVSKSEAPKQAAETSSAEECDSLLPSAPLLSAKPAASSNEQTDFKNESLLVLEAQKEDLETSSLVESGCLVIEIPALESALGPLHQDEETVEGSVVEQPCCLVVNSPMGCEGILVDGCVLTNQDAVAAMSCRAEMEIKAAAIDGSGCLESDPEFDRLSEFEYGANEICLNEINLKNEEIVSDLKSSASSVKDLQFSGGDCPSNTSGESQMASREQSFSSAAMGLQEGGLYFPHNNTNLSFEGNMKSVMDPNDAVEGLHVDPHTLTSNLPNISADWCNLTNDAVEGLHADPHTSTNNLPNIDASLLGISAENSEKVHDGLGDQCFRAQDKVLTVGYAYAFERSTLLPVREVEENSAKQEESLQCCDPGMVLGSDSPRELAGQKTLKLNGILEGNNSAAIADISCITYERRGNAEVGQSNEDLSSLRRSSREKKYFKKTSNMQYSRKGSKKASMDLLSTAVRSKRSFVNRSARVSKWGLLESLSKYITLNNRVLNQGTGIVSSGGRSRKKDKVHVGASSHGSNSKAMNHAPSGQFSLKLKLVRKDKHVIEPSPLTGIDSHVNPFIGSGDNQLELTNSVKDATEESSIRDVENAFDIKLAVPENSGVAVHSVDKDLDVTLMSVNSSSIGVGNLSDKELQKSGGSTDDTHLNSGTSPDSEVIHVPNSQFAVKELEGHHNVGMDSVKATHSPAEIGTPAMAKMRKKKGKKEQMCQPGDSGVQNGHLSLSVIDKTSTRENYSENGTKQDMATRLDVDHGSVDSWNSTKLLTSAEAKGNRKPKGLKLKEKTKVKSKPASASRLKMDNSRKGKGDKWKLIGKGSISENGTLDLLHRKEDDPEAAGKHGMDVTSNTTNITSSGVASEDVTSLPVVPGVAGKQKTQPRTAWVCCDDCFKWRCIPAQLADVIEETNCRWTCKDNQDKAFADCSVPQEKSNAEINVELNLSEDEEGSDVHFSGKYYSLKHSTVPQQSSWMLIKSNIFLHRCRQTQTLDEIMVCHCTPSRDGKLGCRDDCLNRMLNIECVQGTCPCMDLCSNQQFQRQSYAKLKMFRSGKKGYGLQVLENISEGRFLIEYVGEVLDLPAYEARQRDYASKGHKHFYFMTLNGNEVIDACAKGNLGRFINHSCDPNCRTEKWMINGEICIGLFAVRDIKKGEELTFDYNYVRVFGAAAKKCYCGSPQCRGYIGGDRLDNEVVVQSDSDEEFPEPVALYENGEIADDINFMSESNSLGVMEEKTEDTSLQNEAEILLGGKAMTDILKESLVLFGGQLHSIAEKDIVHSSVLESEIVDKSTLDAPKESPINRISKSITSSKRPDNLYLNKWYPKSSLDSVDARFDKSATETTGGKAVQSEIRPRMKISRPSKSGKSKESNDGLNGGTIDKAMVTYSKSQSTPTKLKKLVESSVKHHFEIVEEKLNELLDDAGGICKRKDAFKGYLKLLVLTAASGDCNHHEAIQSNKDLSMILDAILKTKSRTVLTDILNKNGLQMLHSMMKKCRGNYNMIPILRKLLKVFEFLAERKILTLEHINKDSPRPGVESFRDSMLNLTEHEDWKVHQIARSFRDRWIPRTVKKVNCMENGDGSLEFKRAPNGSRSVGSHHHWSDHVERPSESNYGIKQSLPPDHLIDSNKGSHIGEGLANAGGSVRKRKSRWDQLSVTVSPHEIMVQKIEPLQPRRREEVIHDLHTSSDEIHHFKEDGEMQENEDAPPGFSCPSFGGGRPSKGSSSPVIPITQQYPGPLKCPSQVPLGYAQERYNSGSPVAYGIPFNSVQKFGTPQASTADGWVIAPGMPFRPFPPLPLCPREGQKREPASAFTDVLTNTTINSREGYVAAPNHTNQGCPPSSSARLPNMIPTVNTHLQHDRAPYSVKRRNFKQRRNDLRKPPWGFDRGGHGSGRNFPRRPDVVNVHPEYVNNGV